ncbi:MAG: site-specific integrase [Planctomycetes bacterium]|nr:site-specific integrase [Planctomycetota bacterium]
MGTRFIKYLDKCKEIKCNGRKGNYCPKLPKKKNGDKKACGRWAIEFFDENHIWRQVSFKDIASRSEAARRHSLIIGDRERGRLDLPKLRGIPTLTQYAKKYLDACKNEKENTRLSKTRAVNTLINHLGDYHLDRLNFVVVSKFIRERQEVGSKNSTINEDIAKLKAMLYRAMREGIINTIPCRDVKKLKTVESRKRILTPGEIHTMLTKTTGKDRLIILTALFTGARLNEVLSLTWKDIDFTRGLVSIMQTKTGKPITLPLSTFLKNELMNYQKQNTPGESSRIFESKKIDYNVASSYSRSFRRLFKNLCIADFSFHCLRHTFASLQLELGTNPVLTKELLGHSNINMTMVYTHTNIEGKKHAIHALTEYIQNAINETNTQTVAM